MVFNVDNIEISIEQVERRLRLKTDTNSILLENLLPEEIVRVTNKNYEIVKAHFHLRAETKVSLIDFKQVCLRIVFLYLHIYNLRKRTNKNKKNIDSTFLSKDFDHPQTNDIIIQFFKEKYPNNYADKCEAMLDMTSEKFKAYDKNRQDFQNMF